MWTILLTVLAAASYLGAATLLALPLTRRAPVAHNQGLGLACVAVLLHALGIVSEHSGGIDLHFFAALSLIGWGVACVCLVVNVFRRVKALGVIVFPLAAVLALIALASPHAPVTMDWQIRLHVVIALLGYSVLSIAALLAIMLALQERALRRHRLGGLLNALPPLTLTESLMFQLIGLGFVLLTLTLVTGALFVDNLFAQHLAHKTLLSIAAWAVFGVLLFGRWRYGWRGRRAVRLTLIGMGALLLAFFGSKFVLEVVLQRGM